MANVFASIIAAWFLVIVLLGALNYQAATEVAQAIGRLAAEVSIAYTERLEGGQ